MTARASEFRIPVMLLKQNNKALEKNNPKKSVNSGNESSSIDHLSATDFEICQTVQNFIKHVEPLLGEECSIFMESSYRGLSHKMQLVMTHRLITYLQYGDRLTTGVNHVDELIEKIVQKIPSEIKALTEVYRMGISVNDFLTSN